MLRPLLTLSLLLTVARFTRGQAAPCSTSKVPTKSGEPYLPNEIAWADSISNRSGKLQTLVGKGELDGFISYEQFWRLHKLLNTRHPDIVRHAFVIGKTFNGQEIKAFFMGNHEEDEDKKDIIMFDALHHAREFVTLSMIVRIMEDQVSGIVKKSKEVLKFFRNNRLLIVPVVNVDTFARMSKAYGTSEWPSLKMMRKNQNGINVKCDGQNIFGGVDLNRNYPVHFGQGNPQEGSSNDKCNEEYRGEKAFSEPETQAIKTVIERYDRIVSAMNFHAYGDLWIYPANFQEDSGPNILRKLNLELWKKYKLFEKVAPWTKRDKHGNAKKTVNYCAQGEAADWMALSKGIFAFSPELGTDEIDNNLFYPDSRSQLKLIDENYKIVQAFLKFHIPKFHVILKTKDSIKIGLSSIFPLKNIQIRILNMRARDVLLNGKNITNDLTDLGLRYGDVLEFKFCHKSLAAIVKKNWRKKVKPPFKRFVRVAIGRNVRKTIGSGYSWNKFETFTSIAVFL